MKRPRRAWDIRVGLRLHDSQGKQPFAISWPHNATIEDFATSRE